jgi:cytochrome oxidase Cu insertion factor (SCO1/SenC/PrrC family)
MKHRESEVTMDIMDRHRYISSWIAITIVFAAAIAVAEGEGEMIAVGEPFVEFELQAQDGTIVRSADLEGRPYLLFFYPKADTPG